MTDSHDGQVLAAPPPEGSGKTDPEALTAELARVQAERDSAVSQLDKKGRSDRRRARYRRWVVDVLIVLFAILLPITVTVAWAHYTAINSSGFRDTVRPLASNPAVTAAAATRVTDQIFAALDAQDQVASALPPKASFLAAPITTAAKGYVNTAVTKVLQSPQFQQLWATATDFAHTQLVSVLEGNSSSIRTTDGQVVLNLVPLVNAALQNVQGFASGIVGKPITLPTISANDIPSEACAKISAALNRPLPSTCGQIPLFPASKLVQARRAAKAFDRGTVLLLIVTPLLAALAVAVSRRRRRSLLQLTVVGLLGLVLVRRAMIWLEDSLVNSGLPQFKAAREAIMAQLLHNFFDLTAWILAGLLVVGVVAVLSGPYGWAVRLRTKVGSLVRGAGHLVVATAQSPGADATVDWARAHIDVLRVAGAVLAALVLLVFSLSWVGFLILAAILLAYELWLTHMHRSVPPEVPAAPPPAA